VRVAAYEAATGPKRRDPTLGVVLLFAITRVAESPTEPALYPNNDQEIEAFVRRGQIDFTRKWTIEIWQSLADKRVVSTFKIVDYKKCDGFCSSSARRYYLAQLSLRQSAAIDKSAELHPENTLAELVQPSSKLTFQ
jgi:hypothetical protein